MKPTVLLDAYFEFRTGATPGARRKDLFSVGGAASSNELDAAVVAVPAYIHPAQSARESGVQTIIGGIERGAGASTS